MSVGRSLETFVSLLRNEEKATNVDVEMYFADFKKLTLKMERMDPLTLDQKKVESKLQQLKAQQGEFTNAFPDLASFIEWGIRFCEYASLAISSSEE